MIDPRDLAEQLVDDQAVAEAARRLGGRLASLHAFTASPTARLYPLEARRRAWRVATALHELLEAAEAATAREEATP